MLSCKAAKAENAVIQMQQMCETIARTCTGYVCVIVCSDYDMTDGKRVTNFASVKGKRPRDRFSSYKKEFSKLYKVRLVFPYGYKRIVS